MRRIEFSIRYSQAAGYEAEALALARRLFARYDTGIDALSLVPTATERLALYFNDRLVASLDRDGRAPTAADVRELFHHEGITVVRRPEQGSDADDLPTIPPADQKEPIQ